MPIKQRPRRLPYAYREESEKQIKEMLENGVIKPSTSPWSSPIVPEDRAKTAFVTQNGLYEFTRMLFGLKTAPATFQRAMEVILSGLTFETCLCYLDDVIIFGKNLKEHNDRLSTVLTRFR